MSSIYRSRFLDAEQSARREAWAALVDVAFQPWIQPSDTVLDLGAGRCEFINAVRCGRRLAVDLNPDVAEFADPGVEIIATSSDELGTIPDGSIDVAFVSNFFEHLPDASTLLRTLRELRRVLSPAGRLLVLQPNIRLTGHAYWDFVDHSLALTDRSLVEAVVDTGFEVRHLRVRFMPYTTVGRRIPRGSTIRMYLRLRPLQWLLGKQTFLVASPVRPDPG